MNSRDKKHAFDGISNVFFDIDPKTIRLLSDRVLIRDLPENEVEKIGLIFIPHSANDVGAGKNGLLRWGEVIAVGPGDRFIELDPDKYGLADDGKPRLKLIEGWCEVCEGRGRVFDAIEYRNKACPSGCENGRVPVTVPPQCKPGDVVLYDRMRHMELVFDGVTYCCVHAEQSVLLVRDPQPEKREWVYVQRPSIYEIPGCECGNNDPDWSEFKGMLWCQVCQKDFIPKCGGVFDGPIPVNVAELIGLCFDRFNLATKQVEKFGEEVSQQ